MKFKGLKDLYIHELKDLYDAETRLEGALGDMADKASSPKLKKTLQSRRKETVEHRRRLEEICSDLEQDPRGETCQAMQGLIAEGRKIIDASGDETTLDAALIAMGNRIKHYEIAGYGAARTHAGLLGHDSHVRLLQNTLDEEGATDHALMDLAKELNVAAAGPRSILLST